MPTYTCVFVDDDQQTAWMDSEPMQIQSGSLMHAAIAYKDKALEANQALGPCVKVSNEHGGYEFFKVAEYHNAKNRAKQSTTLATDTLLKELISEQKQANETLKKIRWSLLVIHLILVLWYVFGWVIKPL